jgi:ATP-dependent RNA helicase DDX54/DBP10
MGRRPTSPTPSEGEVNILSEIFQEDVYESTRPKKRKRNDAYDRDMGDVLDGPAFDQEDDEAFIALQQAASFRKASNLKGKSVKKGGGFQAMGAYG